MKNKMTKLKRLLVGSTSRKTKITLPPMPDNMLKNDYPDWLYAAEDLYELSKEEDLYYTPWNDRLLNNRKKQPLQRQAYFAVAQEKSVGFL